MSVITPPGSLILPEWREGDGPVPYVWDSLPKGHRCAWSCVWLVRGEEKTTLRIGPLSWHGTAVENMTVEQICAELADNKSSGRGLEVFQLLDSVDEAHLGGRWRKEAFRLLSSLRQNYVEFAAEFAPPPDDAQVRILGGMVKIPMKRRPGWEQLFKER